MVAQESAVITLHHLEISRSHRIIWLLEELSVEYEIKTYRRDPKTRLAPPEYLALHPCNTAPIITDGDLVLAESGAIIEYILLKYGEGRLKPLEGSPEWAQYIYWLHFAEGSFMPISIIYLLLDTTYQKSPFFIKPIVASIRNKWSSLYLGARRTRQLEFIEATLSKNTWLVGDSLSAADIQMAIPLVWTLSRGKALPPMPKTKAYLENIKKRPAFIRTLEVGGPLEATL